MPALPATDQGIRGLRLDAEVIRLGLPPTTLQIEYRDTKAQGLSLIVGKRARSWTLTYSASVGRRRTSLGQYPDLSLADARRNAEAKRVASRSGVDHQQEKREYRAARTVAEIAEEYLAKAATQFASYRCYRGVIRGDVIPALGTKKMVDIRRRDLNAIIDRPLSEGKLAMAIRVFQTLQSLFKWAASRGEIEDNPCDGLRMPAKTTSRDRALSDAEMMALWQGLPKISPQAAAAIKLLALTGQRLNEVVGAKWSEIDFQRALWTLPANEPGRSKKRKAAHLVPLSPAALAIFAALQEANGEVASVFRTKGKSRREESKPATRSMLSSAKIQLKDALPGLADWRIHDLRRTCRTGMGMLGVPQHVAELVLGHALTGVVAVYDRHSYLTEKRDALNRWADHLLQAVGEAPAVTAEIIALRASA